MNFIPIGYCDRPQSGTSAMLGEVLKRGDIITKSSELYKLHNYPMIGWECKTNFNKQEVEYCRIDGWAGFSIDYVVREMRISDYNGPLWFHRDMDLEKNRREKNEDLIQGRAYRRVVPTNRTYSNPLPLPK